MAGSLDLGSLILRVTCNTDSAIKGLNGVADHATKAVTSVERLSRFGDGLTSLGRSLTMTLTVPIVALGTAAINTGMEFEQAMAKVQATAGIASNTSEEFKALEAAAREVGRTTQLSAKESADALYYMALAGWDVQEMLDGINPIANLSIATMTDLARTSDIVTDSFSAFGYETDQLINGVPALEHYVDVLAQTVRSSNTDLEQLGEAFKYVAPICGTLGYSVDDVAIALGLMADQGIKASTAGTTLRSALSNLANPTDKMKAAMDDLGISLSNNGETAMSFKELMDSMRDSFKDLNVSCIDSQGNLLEYDSILQAVSESGENTIDSVTGLTQIQKIEAASIIFGKRAMSGMLAVLTASDEEYQQLTEAIYGANGATQEMVDIMMNTGKGSLIRIKSALEDIGISLYENVEVALKDVLLTIERFTQGLALLMATDEEFTQKFIRTATALAAIGPILLIIGTAMKTVAAMTTLTNTVLGALGITASLTVSGFLALAAGVAGVVIAVKKNVGGLKDSIKDSLNIIKSSLEGNKEQWQEAFGIISGVVQGFYYNVITPCFEGIGEIVRFAADIFSELFNSVSKAVVPVAKLIEKAYYTLIQPVFSGMIRKVRDVIQLFRADFPLIKETVGNVCDAIGGFLGETLGGALDGIIKIFEKLQPVVEVVWEAILQVIHKSIKGVCDYVNNLLIPAFKDLVRFIETYISPIFEKIWDAFSKGAEGKGGKVVDFIHNTLYPALEELSDFLNFTVYPALRDVWQGLLETVGQTITTIAEWVENNLIPAFQNMYNYFVEVLWPSLQTVWDSISQVIGIAIGLIVSLVNDVLIPAFKDIGTVIIEHVWPMLQTAWDGICSIVSIAIPFIKGLIDDVLTPVFKTVSDICVNYVWPLIKIAWEGIMTVVGWACDAIGAAIKIAIPIIQAIADFCTDYLFPAFNEVWTFISDLVTLVIDTLVDLWNSSLKPCWDSLVDFCQVVLWPIVEFVWESIKTLVSSVCQIISPIIEAVKWVLEKLGITTESTGDSFDSAFNIIKTIVTVAMGVVKSQIDFITGILKGWTDTVKWVKDMVSTACSGISSAFSSAFGAASSAVSRVVGALKNVVSWVSTAWEKVKSFASNAASKVAGFLGFAEGTNSAPAGTAWVAEQGPELISSRSGLQLAVAPSLYDFAGGEKVYTAEETEAILRDASKTRKLLEANQRMPVLNSLGGPRMGSNDLGQVTSLLIEMVDSMKDIELNNNMVVDGTTVARSLVKPFERELGRVQRSRSYARGGSLLNG